MDHAIFLSLQHVSHRYLSKTEGKKEIDFKAQKEMKQQSKKEW